MNRANLKAFSQEIKNAGLHRETAFRIELAVGFAVHMDSHNARLSRAVLCEIYAMSGYKSSKPGDLDWRKVNRHITAALALYDFLGAEEIAGWATDAGKSRKDLVEALVKKLEPYKVKTVNEVLDICGKISNRARGPRMDPIGTHRVDTKHVHVTIPPTATRTELMELALAIMKLAENAPSNGHHDEDDEPHEPPSVTEDTKETEHV
jgi:hypothetical protein